MQNHARNPKSDTQWHTQSPEGLIEALESDAEQGLSSSEAARRLKTHGPNRLREAVEPSLLSRFVGQFKDVTVMALVVAAIIAVVLGALESGEASLLERYGDAAAILAIVLLNAILGTAQERKASQALARLQSMTSPRANVVRDGAIVEVEAEAIVPGDVVRLEEGDRAAADVRLLESAGLAFDEAPLTGESAPVRKNQTGALDAETVLAERRNMAFMGTHATSGRGRGVVVATGRDTALGQIAELLGEVETPETPLERELRRFGTWVVIGCVVVSVVVFVAGWLRLDESFRFLFLTAVGLAVAAIPEGLPAITTIVLALGVQRMASRKALVRHLPAVETLGETQIICTDKTGTLTQGVMTARRVMAGGRRWEVSSGEVPRLLDDAGAAQTEPSGPLGHVLSASRYALAARLSDDGSGGTQMLGDPTDGALLVLHERFHGDEPEGAVVAENPFDTDRKLATVVVQSEGDHLAFVHGAPEAVLARCTSEIDAEGEEVGLSEVGREALLGVTLGWAQDGLRVLALARRGVDVAGGLDDGAVAAMEEDLVFLGLVGMNDPPRDAVRPALVAARRAGIRTVMITGDHPLTGAAIAQEIGLVEGEARTIAGWDLAKLSDEALKVRAPQIDVVARATAADKLRFVEALMGAGHTVAMTGDGVNDAPALKASSIGVAMGLSGTDVTREAADLVLADDNYATIVAAVEEGRIIFANIQTFIVFLLSANAGLVFAVFVAALMGWPPILTPTQLLWINLITNGLPALALGMETQHADPMSSPPRAHGSPLLASRDWLWMGAYGAVMAAIGLAMAAQMLGSDPLAVEGEQLDRIRTMVFTVMALGPLFHAFNCRSRDASIFELGFLTNTRLLGAFAVAVALQALAVYTPGLSSVFHTVPLGGADVLWVLVLSALVWPVGELHKGVKRLWRARS